MTEMDAKGIMSRQLSADLAKCSFSNATVARYPYLPIGRGVHIRGVPIIRS